MRQASIVVVGSMIYDFRITADRLPRPGETITGYGFGTGTGGKGANQAVAAARSGASVHMIGRIGRDVFGDQVIRQFGQDDLGHDYVVRDPSAVTATCLIHVDKNGENDIIIAEGANGCVCRADIESARPVIEQARVLILQNEIPLAASQYAAEIANAAGAIVIYNPAPAKLLPDELLRQITFFTPNEPETEFYTGIAVDGDIRRADLAADRLLDRGIRQVLITLGGRGAYYAGSDCRRLYPAFPIKPVDTTAAGDAFNGGLAAMLSEGKSIPEAIRFANAAGAVCAQRAGAQTAIGYRQEVEALMAERRD